MVAHDALGDQLFLEAAVVGRGLKSGCTFSSACSGMSVSTAGDMGTLRCREGGGEVAAL